MEINFAGQADDFLLLGLKALQRGAQDPLEGSDSSCQQRKRSDMDSIMLFFLVVFATAKNYILHALALTVLISATVGAFGGSWIDAAKVCALIAVVLACAAGLLAVKLIRG
ncbi:MAG: hypothetical protein K2Y39_22270 [Candidatus Obscuribacterales bacterium]|nr:hypothetical protein [Candidatus Obscuribacterales bacterium]